MTATLIVALDARSRDDALRLRDQVAHVHDYFKVGKELFTAAGPAFLAELSDHRVFLDLKFHDIPNTVSGAVAAAAELGASIVDVHASGGVGMMEAAKDAAARAENPPLVFGVTVLTSLNEDDLDELGIEESASEHVVRLAQLALASGLDGVVASPMEVALVRDATEQRLKLIVPGIRPQWASGANDQKRVATPSDAAKAGADFVVVGRAISQQSSPRDATKRILDELASV